MNKWLFFDMGSTLINERECYKIRNLETVADSDVAPEKIDEIERYYAQRNRYYYGCACDELGLKRKSWHTELGVIHPYTIKVVTALSARFHLGIIANQMPGTKERLKEWGLRPYFSVVASSDEIGIEKPEPGLFIAALEMADCKEEEAVMIGDRLDNDIVPAAKIGMKTIWVKQGYGGLGNPDLLEKKPDLIVDTVEELLNCDLAAL